MKKWLLLLLLLLCVGALTACGDKEETVADGQTLTLKVYNWGEYISDGSLDSFDTNAAFEDYYEALYYERYGVRINVKVVYTTYATNEDMYSKIVSGAGTYDVIIPSDYMVQKLAQSGMLEPLYPEETVDNFQYIEDSFKHPYYDPDNLYSVPYTYGMVGIIYNTTMVDAADAAEESWGLLWNEAYKGKILQFNNPRDGFGSAMYYKNIDINSTDPDDWQAALDLLMEQKPYVQAYVSDEIFNKMISGSAAVAPYYAGDYLIMSEDNDALAFYYPKEGTNIFVDAMCIPKDENRSPEVLAMAREYINFMLSEEAAIANALYIGYASPNTLVKDNDAYKEELGDGYDILYNNENANNVYDFDPYYHSFDQETQNMVNDLWESLKAESAIEPWVHIASALIVVGVLSFGIVTTVRRRTRSRHYRKKK